MKNDRVGVGNQDLVWVGIMGSQGPQESELGGQRSRQLHPRAFRTRPDSEGWAHVLQRHGSHPSREATL